MVIEDALRKILSDNVGVRALVGTRIHNGFLPQVMPDSAYPCLAYRKVDEDREPTVASPTTGPPNSTFIFFAVSKGISGSTSAQRTAALVDRAVRGALIGFKDTVVVDALSPIETMEVQGIFFTRAAHTHDDRTETHQYASVYDVHFSDSY